MRLIFALALVFLATVVYAKPLFEEMSDGEDEEGDVQLNDLAELANDDDSIHENDDDGRMKKKVVSIQILCFLLSLSHKRTIRSPIRLFRINEVPTRPPLRFNLKTINF